MNIADSEFRNEPFKFSRLLLCEGEDDRAFFHKLISGRSLQQFHIRTTANKKGMSGGNTKFEAALRAASANRGFNLLRDIVIVSDNDEKPSVSFQNIRAQIVKAGFRAPTSRLEQGLGPPYITVIMVPLNGLCGNLECVCGDAARRSDPSIASHTDYFLSQLNAETWSLTRQGKLWLRANIAARAIDPCVSFGGVFREPRYSGLIPINDPSFDEIAGALSSIGRPLSSPSTPSGSKVAPPPSRKRDQTLPGPQMRPQRGRSR